MYKTIKLYQKYYLKRTNRDVYDIRSNIESVGTLSIGYDHARIKVNVNLKEEIYSWSFRDVFEVTQSIEEAIKTIKNNYMPDIQIKIGLSSNESREKLANNDVILIENDHENLKMAIIDLLKYFYGYKELEINFNGVDIVIPVSDNEYFSGIDAIVYEMQETERQLNSLNKSWQEKIEGTLGGSSTDTEYENLLEAKRMYAGDILYGADILWEYIHFNNHTGPLSIRFNKRFIEIDNGINNSQSKVTYNAQNIHFQYSEPNFNIEQKTYTNTSFLLDRELHATTSDIDIKICLDKDNGVINSFAKIFIKSQNDERIGTYYFNFDHATGYTIDYMSSTGAHKTYKITPELKCLMKTTINIQELKDILNYILKDTKNTTLEELLSLEELKHTAPNIPVKVIRDNLKDFCYTISPKKEKAYARTRKIILQ